jgi:hypothetical protein
MNDGIDGFRGLQHRVDIAEVSNPELEVWVGADGTEPRVTIEQAIDHPYAVATLEKKRRQLRADVSGSAGDEDRPQVLRSFESMMRVSTHLFPPPGSLSKRRAASPLACSASVQLSYPEPT